MPSPLKEKGHKKMGGRKKGSQNKFTKTVKETVLAAFNDLQQDKKVNLTQWAKENPKDFYNIAAKLIPTELTGKDGESLKISPSLIKLKDGTIISI